MTARLNALRARLQQARCDAYVSLSPSVNQYLTGFRGSTSAVLVTANQARFFCDFRYTEQAGQQIRNGFEIEEVKGSLPGNVGKQLSETGLQNAAFEPELMTVAQLRALEQSFGSAMLPMSDMVSVLRRTKDPSEIDQIRNAQALAESVLSGVLENLDAGMTEREVAAEIDYELQRRGASGPSFDTIVLFGARTSLPHGEASTRALEWGDLVLIDFGCRLNGYCSDLTRTFVFGTISSVWLEEVYDLVLTAQRIALEAVRPGLACRELDAVARGLISDAGYGEYFGHGLGHGVGIDIHEAPRVNSESDATLEPGMIITIEPGIYLPGKGGVRIEDLVAVTENGCQNLTAAPKELRTLHG